MVSLFQKVTSDSCHWVIQQTIYPEQMMDAMTPSEFHAWQCCWSFILSPQGSRADISEIE